MFVAGSVTIIIPAYEKSTLEANLPYDGLKLSLYVPLQGSIIQRIRLVLRSVSK